MMYDGLTLIDESPLMLYHSLPLQRCITHAGLLEFTSPEGVVAMPRKVAECLWGRGREAGGPVTVTYKRLEKGTFVRCIRLHIGISISYWGR